MQRQGTTFVRTIRFQDEHITQPLKTVESRGRKLGNNKISIYSQKYTSGTSTHSLPQQQATSRTIASITQLRPDLRTVPSECLSTEQNLCRTDEKPFRAINLFQIKKPKEDGMGFQQRAMLEIHEQMTAIHRIYQAKMKQITDENLRIVHELKLVIMENQRKLCEKDQIIQKLITINNNNRPSTVIVSDKMPRITISVRDSPTKQKPNNSNSGNMNYLQKRIKDLQNTLKIIMQSMVDSEDNISLKMRRLQNELVKFHTMRIAACSNQLRKYIEQYDHRLEVVQSNIQNNQNKTFALNSSNSENCQGKYLAIINQMKNKINQISKELTCFEGKQFKYQNTGVQQIQNFIIGLIGKVDDLQFNINQRGRTSSTIFDQDQFFYPTTDRKIIQTNDQYQHFQSESDQQSQQFLQSLGTSHRKQNKSPNLTNKQSPKPFKLDIHMF